MNAKEENLQMKTKRILVAQLKAYHYCPKIQRSSINKDLIVMMN